MSWNRVQRICAFGFIAMALFAAGLAFARGDWQQSLWAINGTIWAGLFLMATRHSASIITICVEADVPPADPAVRRESA
ncbi:hypothetical protein [Phenylobacterium sp.]|uniref:hypothetical protein n=1 Tax=Phenylobacterium sp. TaxID=1871053 RepID=UPI003001B684